MAHVQDRGRSWRPVTSRYRARYRAPDRKERARTFARRVDAERFLNTVEAAKVRGDWIDPTLGRAVVGDWSNSWIRSVAPALKPKTVASYESLLRSQIIPALGAYQLGALRPSDVQAWIGRMEARGLSASRVHQAHVVLGQLLDAAVRDGLVSRNAARGVKLPRLRREEAAYFDPEDVQRIAAEMPAPYDLVVRLLGTLGLRWGEVAALRRGSIDLVRRRVTIEASLAEVNGKLVHGPTKTHASRSIPLPGSLVVALERHLEANVGPAADAYAFTGERGGLLRHSGFYHRLWRPALRTLGLPIVGVHVLRHSAAAGLIAAGAAPKAVQSIMGHASAAFTLTVYGHLFDTDLDALADRLDELRSDRLGGAPRPLRGLPERTAQAV